MKKLLIPIITLIAGFAIGYISNNKPPCPSLTGGGKQNPDNEKLSLNFRGFRGPRKKIDRPVAMDMINSFRSWNQEPSHRGIFNTATGNSDLRGFFLSINDLDKIMARRTADTKGISIYMAKDVGSASNSPVFTLVFMRADTNLLYGKPEDKIRTKYINDYDDAYDFVKPCPDDCGNFETATLLPTKTAIKKGK